MRHADHLELREVSGSSGAVASAAPELVSRDGDGAHYVAQSGGHVAIELVIPADARRDAVERIYDTSRGDRQLVHRETCTARGGYNDALVRFLKGESFDDVAAELDLGDHDDAKRLVHDALRAAQVRYYRTH